MSCKIFPAAIPGRASSVRRTSLVEKPTPSLAPGLHLELTSCSQCPHCHRLLYDEVRSRGALLMFNSGGQGAGIFRRQ